MRLDAPAATLRRPGGGSAGRSSATRPGLHTAPEEPIEPVVDHLQITVRDFEAAVSFYDRLMPLLGFDPAKRVRARIEEHEFEVVEYSHPRLAFAVTSPRPGLAGERVHRRRPGALHHLAFRAGAKEEVDALYAQVKAIGATIVSPPRDYPEYTPPGYYAFFFKDVDGIKYEIVTHSRCL